MLSDLDDFYCFAQVVEHGGFSAAERATDIPKSKLSRRVYNLEERLGVRLIQRSSRHFAVTDIGMNIYRHAQVMMNAAQAAHDLVDHLSLQPRGVIKLSLPVSIAQNEIARILPSFLKTYPEIKVQMMVTNRRVDIINEGFDIALRVRSTSHAPREVSCPLSGRPSICAPQTATSMLPAVEAAIRPDSSWACPVAPSGVAARACSWSASSSRSSSSQASPTSVTPKGRPPAVNPAGTATAARSIRFTKLV